MALQKKKVNKVFNGFVFYNFTVCVFLDSGTLFLFGITYFVSSVEKSHPHLDTLNF